MEHGMKVLATMVVALMATLVIMAFLIAGKAHAQAKDCVTLHQFIESAESTIPGLIIAPIPEPMLRAMIANLVETKQKPGLKGQTGLFGYFKVGQEDYVGIVIFDAGCVSASFSVSKKTWDQVSPLIMGPEV